MCLCVCESVQWFCLKVSCLCVYLCFSMVCMSLVFVSVRVCVRVHVCVFDCV